MPLEAEQLLREPHRISKPCFLSLSIEGHSIGQLTLSKDEFVKHLVYSRHAGQKFAVCLDTPWWVCRQQLPHSTLRSGAAVQGRCGLTAGLRGFMTSFVCGLGVSFYKFHLKLIFPLV